MSKVTRISELLLSTSIHFCHLSICFQKATTQRDLLLSLTVQRPRSLTNHDNIFLPFLIAVCLEPRVGWRTQLFPLQDVNVKKYISLIGSPTRAFERTKLTFCSHKIKNALQVSVCVLAGRTGVNFLPRNQRAWHDLADSHSSPNVTFWVLHFKRRSLAWSVTIDRQGIFSTHKSSEVQHQTNVNQKVNNEGGNKHQESRLVPIFWVLWKRLYTQNAKQQTHINSWKIGRDKKKIFLWYSCIFPPITNNNQSQTNCWKWIVSSHFWSSCCKSRQECSACVSTKQNVCFFLGIVHDWLALFPALLHSLFLD